MNWSHDKTLVFIESIRERPVIWDTTSPDYKYKIKRNNAIEEVAQIIGISPKEAVYKWTSLRGQYQREKRRLADLRKVTGLDAGLTCKWFAFNRMDSLMQCDIIQDSFSNDEDSQNSSSNTLDRERANDYTPEQKKPKLHDQMKLKTNSFQSNTFGDYIGEQLVQVDLFQRHVAEKLISEVLFLARTGNLDYSTKIESTQIVHSSNVVHSNSPAKSSYPMSSMIIDTTITPPYMVPMTQLVATSNASRVETPLSEEKRGPSPIPVLGVPNSPPYTEIKVEPLT